MRHTYSSLANYKTCPRQFYHVRIARDVPYEQSPEAQWGDVVHDACEQRLKSPTYQPPAGTDNYMAPVDRLRAALDGFAIYPEVQLAIDEFGQAAEWRDCKFRGKIDMLAVKDDYALVVDWKTGKVRPQLEQIRFYAMFVLANFPAVQYIDGALIWLKFKTTTRASYARAELPAMVADALRSAHQVEADEHWHPRQSGLCKRYCPVLSCEHNGRSKQ